MKGRSTSCVEQTQTSLHEGEVSALIPWPEIGMMTKLG